MTKTERQSTYRTEPAVIQIRPTRAMLRALQERAGPDGSVHLEAKRCILRYFDLLGREAARIRPTREEVDWVEREIDTFDLAILPAGTYAYALLPYMRAGVGAEDAAGWAVVAERLSHYCPGQLLALVDMVERRHPGPVGEAEPGIAREEPGP